jgi:transcriptional regulator with XRE-family HTH domain
MINEVLRLLRVLHDFNLNELSKELEISPSYLSEIEGGKKQPTLDIINRYSKVFKIPASSILFFAEEIEKEKPRKDIRSTLRKKIIGFLHEIEIVHQKELFS